jgi:hypothetical protein
MNISDDDLEVKIVTKSNVSTAKMNKLYHHSSDKMPKGSITVFELLQSYNDTLVRAKVKSTLYNLHCKTSPAYIRSLSWFYDSMNDDFQKAFKAELTVYWDQSKHIKAPYSKLARDIYMQELKSIGIKLT